MANRCELGVGRQGLNILYLKLGKNIAVQQEIVAFCGGLFAGLPRLSVEAFQGRHLWMKRGYRQTSRMWWRFRSQVRKRSRPKPYPPWGHVPNFLWKTKYFRDVITTGDISYPPEPPCINYNHRQTLVYEGSWMSSSGLYIWLEDIRHGRVYRFWKLQYLAMAMGCANCCQQPLKLTWKKNHAW